MGNPAGAYNQRLTWLQGTRTKDTETGEMVLTHEENGSLWGSVEITNGRKATEYGAEFTGGDGEIRLRNTPAVTVDDMLRDGGGITYHIEDIIEGDNELILTVYYNDTLEDFTEEA
jgi:head-tail adaptor